MCVGAHLARCLPLSAATLTGAPVEEPLPELRLVDELEPFERAIAKIRHLGDEAQLTLAEAAALLTVSASTFERLAIPCTPWAARSRRWRYGAILARGRELAGLPAVGG